VWAIIEILNHLDQPLSHLKELLEIRGKLDVIAFDKHPRYVKSRFAQELLQKKIVKPVRIQRHHARLSALRV